LLDSPVTSGCYRGNRAEAEGAGLLSQQEAKALVGRPALPGGSWQPAECLSRDGGVDLGEALGIRGDGVGGNAGLIDRAIKLQLLLGRRIAAAKVLASSGQELGAGHRLASIVVEPFAQERFEAISPIFGLGERRKAAPCFLATSVEPSSGLRLLRSMARQASACGMAFSRR
jgi:hypothetical protein